MRIEELLRSDELKVTISYHINKYGKTFERKLGLTKDDLINDVREQIWKGLLTHNPSRGAGLRTYLHRLIANRFKVLHKKSTVDRYNLVDYYADVFSSTAVDKEYTETEETGETVFERRQIIMQDKARLSPQDAIIYGDLLLGRTLNEMVEINAMPRHKVIQSINRIDEMIRNRDKQSD